MKRNPSCSIRRSLQFSPCPTLRPRDQPLPAEIVPCDLTIGREIFFSGRPSGKRQFSEQNDDDRLEAGDGFSQPTQGYLEGLQPPEIVGLPWRAETSVSRSRRKTSVLRPMISARTARIDDNFGRGTDGSNPLPSSGESVANRFPHLRRPDTQSRSSPDFCRAVWARGQTSHRGAVRSAYFGSVISCNHTT